MKKKTLAIFAVALAGLILAGAYGAKAIRADEVTYPPIVAKIAEKFGLNTDEVGETFKEVWQERHQERQERQKAHFEERLADAVGDGRITEEQKQAILVKHEEMRQRKEEMKKEMRVWAEENGIEWGSFGPRGKGMWGGHFGMRLGK